MTMTENENVFNKIKQVISAASQFNDEQFRLVLEGLVKKGGRDADFLLVKYITSPKVPAETRSKIIHCAGYLQSPLYLVPLKKIIDQDADIQLKKVAIIALAKYNSQRALNILSTALQTIQNPYIQNTLNEQISLIKKNNPILSILPRFLKGAQDPKSFRTVIDILKKILKPADATIFIGYLKSDDPAIANGAFEILCNNGDRTIQSEVFEYFQQLMESFPPEQWAAPSLYLKQYFLRFPSLIFPQISLLRKLYSAEARIEIRQSVISIICHCRAPAAISFIDEIYETASEEFREYIIEESSGNEQAIEFLFEKYLGGQVLKAKIVKAILHSRKGFDYFSRHFPTFDRENQEMIIKSFPDTLQPDMVEFLKKILEPELAYLAPLVLQKIRQHNLISFKDILFDSNKEKLFLNCEEDYLQTLRQLFPIRAILAFLERTALEEMDFHRLKSYFAVLQDISRMEPVILMEDGNLLSLLIIKIINANSSDLNRDFLYFLEQIKTFDSATYKNLLDALHFFNVQRGDTLVEAEQGSIKQARGNFQTISEDLKTIDTLEKEIKSALAKDPPDLQQLRRALVSYHLGAAFKLAPIIKNLAEGFENIDQKYLSSWRDFFKDFPIITQLVKDERERITKAQNLKLDSLSRLAIGESFHHKLRIVINFQERGLTALIYDQFNEILPGFQMLLEETELQPTDILVCDSTSLRNYMNSNSLNTNRIFVLLANRSEFASLKSLNPRAFFLPFSIYRVLKLVLQELFLHRGH